MRRIEIVLGELERLTRGLCLADLAQETAFTAEAIGFNLGLARNSVSKISISYGMTAWQSKAVAARSIFCIARRWKRCWDDSWKSLNARCGRWRMCCRMKSITRPTIRLPA
ncbi:Sigma-54 dependent transcription regulator [Salmonella enterica subsp. enterica]|uniref:Sigma-54 dependent transcription regulator n=1 Tax=Salmonella enterica I TaxID=59201 RepID=A0A379UYE4_SALET|nr:Sigma-54 dependent transcription regulator [Salmonella enterica subsp. enterica]